MDAKLTKKTVRNLRMSRNEFLRVEEAAAKLGLKTATFMRRAVSHVADDVLEDVPEPFEYDG